ncbi:hypothetical protein D5H75_16625 [Bailinhaonella thermotolerans]|uniref:Serine hydrolase n=1 Tax=Bailinhaonella thermotolerans TaxID=1070861 RepID=A0A3A4BMN0_9ACTN|nr:hypothetical protein D5H75_16625 [Bailinhaonella thermotolerans]
MRGEGSVSARPSGTAARPPAAGTASARPRATPKPRRERPRVPQGMTAGYVVYDRPSGRVVLQGNARRAFRSASVVKILIALDHLESRKPGAPIPKETRALLEPMLRVSDDRSATALWRRGGQRQIITRTARRLGLPGTLPPPASKPGFWGYTTITAADIVKTYRHILDRARPEVRDFILGNLRKAGQCGTDGFDQYFGIPRAVPRPWAIKQGWSGHAANPPRPCKATRASAVLPARARTSAVPDLGHPVLHTTGVLGPGDRRIMVILSTYPSGTTWDASVARLTRFTRALTKAAAP